jgi:hypothetical protein
VSLCSIYSKGIINHWYTWKPRMAATWLKKAWHYGRGCHRDSGSHGDTLIRRHIVTSVANVFFWIFKSPNWNRVEC